MRKREAFKEQTYFDHRIWFYQRDIDELNATLGIVDIGEPQKNQLNSNLFKKTLELIILRYSQGENIKILKEDFSEIIEFLSNYYLEAGKLLDFKILEEYEMALWMVSLALLFKIPDDDFKRLVKVLGNENKDFLYEYIVGQRIINRELPDNILYPLPYHDLVESVKHKPIDRSVKVYEFLKNYYYSMEDTYWFNSHLKDEGFFGYWCFALAAIVKINDMDDILFADHMFYPRDLLGKKLFRTWEDSTVGESDRKEYETISSK